jgi:predicted DCC family thiol-disulfide oxidoreductase YuxK
MLRLEAFQTYSYRADPAVPPFPDGLPLIVFDGVCVLCSEFARFIARRDRQGRLRFASAPSPLDKALFRDYGRDPVNYETNLLIADGCAFGKLRAFAGIMGGLGGLWRLAGIVSMLPARTGDRLYDLIAQNRNGLFGRTEAYMVPEAGWCDRVIG